MHPQGTAERICAATEEVFTTMLSLETAAGESYLETAASPSSEGVVALIGLAGDWIGTASLNCSGPCACRIASQMLMTDAQAVDGDVLDAVAEVANMIIGNVKTGLEMDLGPMGMSIPTIIFGKNFSARSAGSEEWLTVPFTCEGERIEVKLCLTPNRAGRAASMASYALQGVVSSSHSGGEAKGKESPCKQA
jgi:chemotaxis protein CheX